MAQKFIFLEKFFEKKSKNYFKRRKYGIFSIMFIVFLLLVENISFIFPPLPANL